MFGSGDNSVGQFSGNWPRRSGKRPTQGNSQSYGNQGMQQPRFAPQPILFEFPNPHKPPGMTGEAPSGGIKELNLDGGFSPAPADGYRSFFPQWQSGTEQPQPSGTIDKRVAEVEAENEKLRREVEAHKARIQSLEQKLFVLFAKISKLESEEK